MSNKLKLFTLTVRGRTYAFILDYSYYLRYLLKNDKISFLKNFYRYHRPFPFKLDFRCSISHFLIYILYVLGNECYESTSGFFPIKVRFRTLSEATSDFIYSNQSVANLLYKFGIVIYSCFLNEDFTNAMFSSTLRISERLFKSGHWQERNFVSKENI